MASTPEVVSVLGHYGLDPSSVASRRAVIDAVSNGRLELLRAFVETRANVNAADDISSDAGWGGEEPLLSGRTHQSRSGQDVRDKPSCSQRRREDGQVDLVSALGHAGFDVNKTRRCEPYARHSGVRCEQLRRAQGARQQRA